MWNKDAAIMPLSTTRQVSYFLDKTAKHQTQVSTTLDRSRNKRVSMPSLPGKVMNALAHP